MSKQQNSNGNNSEGIDWFIIVCFLLAVVLPLVLEFGFGFEPMEDVRGMR